MIEQYLAHVAIILLPLFALQVWVFRRSFYELPWRLSFMTLYGVIASVWDQLYPLVVLDIRSSFSSVPLIVSFLYGKRLAGSAAVFMFLIWNLGFHPHTFIPVAISTVLYCALPFYISKRYDGMSRASRLRWGIFLSLQTVVIHCIAKFVFTRVSNTASPAHTTTTQMVFHKLIPFFGLSFVEESVMICVAIMLIDNVIEYGKLRLSMVDNDYRYRSLLEFSPLGISIFDRQDRFVLVNSAYQRITGYSSAELIGRTRFEIWFPDDIGIAKKFSSTVHTGEVFVDEEARFRHKTGRPMNVRFTVVPIMAHGKIEGYFSIMTDITESVELEKHVRETEKLSIVGQLAASIAHEIRNPLTALSGFLQLMDEGRLSTKGPHLGVMKDELNRINLIAGQLLLLGKPQAEHFDKHDVGQLIQDVVALLEPQMHMSNIECDVETDVQSNAETGVQSDAETGVKSGVKSNIRTLTILCDANQVKQALINIVKNAIEAMENAGKLTIRVQREPNDRIGLTIQDTGIGFDSDVMKRIGEPFYTTKGEGTGLGLLVTRRIVQAHAGTIEFRSKPGQGTRVTLTFPAASASGIGAESEVPAASGSRAGGGMGAAAEAGASGDMGAAAEARGDSGRVTAGSQAVDTATMPHDVAHAVELASAAGQP
ncbi:ATP-binding protein [Alicyclobacillus ferrooxydans]|uniref:histidine kinase n=1 Tax=Alicyclobacillus ferrooxydans TaxID=471514 RepID=A0A0N8PNX3_9BACL|nr:ATP-binding protein [Alicyclobacillus ferrooxydans]KPV42725.1 hypothetical protein AN477_16160 [Alicyclobacillus ferrooxydans]